MSRHIASPWKTDGRLIYKQTEKGDLPIAVIDYDNHKDKGVPLANAKLIASAPELFELLEMIVRNESFVQHCDVKDEAVLLLCKKAVKKVKSRKPDR